MAVACSLGKRTFAHIHRTRPAGLCARQLVITLARPDTEAGSSRGSGTASLHEGGAQHIVRSEGQPAHDVPAHSGPPLIMKILGVPVGLFCLLLLFKIYKKIARGSLGRVEDRGHIPRDREVAEAVPWYTDNITRTMKKVNYTNYDYLTDQMIFKHRKRRELERDVNDVVKPLQEIKLPENHPWATNENDDNMTDELIMERLSVKRGLPRQRVEAPPAAMPETRQARAHQGAPSSAPGDGQMAAEREAMKERAAARARQNMSRARFGSDK